MSTTQQSLDYYLSRRGQASLAKKHTVSRILQSLSLVVQVSSKIKAMFVFQATEFCNGSEDRMKVIDFTRIRAQVVKKCGIGKRK